MIETNGKKILILKALQNKKALFSGLLAFLITLLWPAIPLKSLYVWLKTLIGLSPTNIGYLILAFLIGLYTALFVYQRSQVNFCPTCKVKVEKRGFFNALIGVLLGACPACIPAIAFFLPLSVTITLSYFSWLFLLLAIVFLSLSIWRIGGFKNVRSN